MILSLFYSYSVLFPNNDFIKTVVVDELLQFPKGKNDDIVDSISQALNYAKSMEFYDIRIRGLSL